MEHSITSDFLCVKGDFASDCVSMPSTTASYDYILTIHTLWRELKRPQSSLVGSSVWFVEFSNDRVIVFDNYFRPFVIFESA